MKCCLCGGQSRMMFAVGEKPVCVNCMNKLTGKALKQLEKETKKKKVSG